MKPSTILAKIYWNKQTGTCQPLPPHPYKQCCQCVQRDFNIVRGDWGEELFIQTLLSVMLQNLF